MAGMLKIFVVLLFVAGLLIGAYAWQQSRKEDDGGNQIVEVTRGSIAERAIAIGQIEPRLKYVVKSNIRRRCRRPGRPTRYQPQVLAWFCWSNHCFNGAK